MNPKRDQGGRSSDLADVPSLARARYVLANTLNEHLVRSSRSLSLEEGGSSLTDGLSYASAIRVLDDGDRETNTQQESDSANSESFTRAASLKSPPGGLSEADLNRFGGSSLRLTSAHQEQLSRELHSTLSSIAGLYSDAENDGLESVNDLPRLIRSQRDGIENEHRVAETYRTEITQVVQDINKLHVELEDDLIDALSTLPPILNARSTAEADLLSTTIEASLTKLSLVRTRTHLALYGHSSPNRPQASMSRALAAAMDKLRTKELAQAEEERQLDAQLAAYEGMLGLVGGRDGGFAQVVEDMARVKRETEECRKDLRRLGWTGD